MIKLLSVEEMRAIEKEAEEKGTCAGELMERAGKGIADWIKDEYDPGVIVGLVGTGNNGGDALIALEVLAGLGWTCRAFLTRARLKSDELVKRAREAGVEIAIFSANDDASEFGSWFDQAAIILDGVLGTGIQLPLKPEAQKLLVFAADHVGMAEIIAVDCPSGVDCNSGEAAPETLPADVTLCMEAVKSGLLRLPAFLFAGVLVVVTLGLPEDLKSWPQPQRFVISDSYAHSRLPMRPNDLHKGSFGSALLAAGSINYTGAALLAARAACRVGTGLVQLAVPGVLHTALAGHLPDVTWLLLPHEMGVISADAADLLKQKLSRADALLLGPGWGQEDTTLEFLKRLLLESPKSAAHRSIGFLATSEAEAEKSGASLPPLVVDADALKLLSKISDWQKFLPGQSILTPHPGEMSILTGLAVEEIQSRRVDTAAKFAVEWGQVVVLKGAFTVIAAPDGQVAVLPIATAALSHAGTGDVLAGIIAGLRAQGLSAWDAAITGAWVHGQAGLICADQFGSTTSVLASDIADAISSVF